MRKSTRALRAGIAGLVSVPLAYWLLCEAVVIFEMWSTSTSSRGELENDLGLGLLLFLVVLPGTLVCSVGVSFAVWRWLGKRGGSHAASA